MTTDPDIASAVASMARLFEGKTVAEQKALLAALERAGAAVYRSMAANEPDPSVKAELLGAAEREEQNAKVLERGG
jgi:hypothetical protein